MCVPQMCPGGKGWSTTAVGGKSKKKEPGFSYRCFLGAWHSVGNRAGDVQGVLVTQTRMRELDYV